MKRTHFFTIASFNYLAQISILKQSLDKTHAEIPFTIFLCDELDESIPPALRGAEIIPISSINLAEYEEMAANYSVIELNTSVKPFCFMYLQNKKSAEFCFYLDPDLVAVDRLQECFELVEEGADIILTPHTTEPIEDTLHPSDHDMARAGIYNLGFCGVATSDTGKRFLGWWARKLLTDCRVDLEHGIFVDQKWCDAVPALFSSVSILRHSGYNIGYWNLMHRPLSRDGDGHLMAADAPVRLLHFSGIDLKDSQSISKHQNRLFMYNINETTRDIFSAYRYNLLANEYFRLIKIPQRLPGHRHFAESGLNSSYRRSLSALLRDAGLADRRPSLADFTGFGLATALTPNSTAPVPDFFHVAYALREDLQEAFPNVNSIAGVAGYMDWHRKFGHEEMRPADARNGAIDHSVNAIEAMIGISKGTPKPSGSIPIELAFAYTTLGEEHRRDLYLSLYSMAGDFSVGACTYSDGYDIPLFLDLLRRARPDLIKAFDLRQKAGRRALLEWALKNFEKEYGTTDRISALLATVRTNPETWLRAYSPARPAEILTEGAQTMDRALWSAAIHYGEKSPGEYAIFNTHDHAHPAHAPWPTGGAELVELRPTLNEVSLVGYPRAEMGMGEHIRNTAAALMQVGLPFDILDFQVDLECGLGNQDFNSHVTTQPSGRINVFHINADQTLVAANVLGDALFRNRYNIGYWAWELERFPSAWNEAIALVDEIWAPSRFIQRALQQATSKPVIHMPLRVEKAACANFNPQDHGLSTGAFNFLFYFDFNSYHQRKNPFGVLDAFRLAFPLKHNEKVRLLIKSIGSATHSKATARLHEYVDSDPRITHIPKTLNATEMAGLMDFADCFVSLHRSEGFGRGMAEAMAARRPVIATAYGGNMDFMTAENSYLVDYRMAPVGKDDYPFGEGARWADANIPHAASLMRHVFTNRREAAERAARGQQTIIANHSTEAIARHLKSRLEKLGLAATPQLATLSR